MEGNQSGNKYLLESVLSRWENMLCSPDCGWNSIMFWSDSQNPKCDAVNCNPFPIIMNTMPALNKNPVHLSLYPEENESAPSGFFFDKRNDSGNIIIAPQNENSNPIEERLILFACI